MPKNRITTAIFILSIGLVILSIAATYYRVFIQRDYEIIRMVEEKEITTSN